MPRKSIHLELPRRIVVLYLLFCMISVVWLAGGIVYVTQATLQSRTESVCLAQLGKATSALEMDYLRNGSANMQSLAQRIQTDARLEYCAVESQEGRYLAHTSEHLVGTASKNPSGQALRWGNVEGVRFADEQLRIVREYRSPLTVGGREIGWLRIAVPETNIWNTIASTAQFAPFTILAPLAMVGVGAVVLRKVVRPMQDLDKQLRQLAVSAAAPETTLRPITERDAVGIGWNRIVDRLQSQRTTSSLSGRLHEMARTHQTGKGYDILQSLSDGIAVTDSDGRISFANSALCALLGITGEPSGLHGSEMSSTLVEHEENAESYDPLLSDSAQRTVVVEIPRKNSSGSRMLRIARHPLRSDEGSTERGHVWSVRDITQQKLAEKMRDQFLDSATHELRTPLANIKAYAETLALSEMLDVDRQKEFCNTINSEATRLARFIDDLLSLSSIEVGSMSINRQTVNAERLFTEVVDKVQPLMDQKKIDFHVNLPEKMSELSVDKEKFIATLVNLLGNAAKYTPAEGRVGLSVRTTDDLLVIDVEDTGVGISAEELPRIFEKFFRSADQRVQEESGTGLGLSLASEVARLHGGELTVTSKLNE